MERKTVEVEPVIYIGSLPKGIEYEFGKLYISRIYMGLGHLCLCGCGEKTFISLKSFNGEAINGWEDGWDLTIDDKNGATLTPSLLHRFACKSHYIITKNKANFV